MKKGGGGGGGGRRGIHHPPPPHPRINHQPGISNRTHATTTRPQNATCAIHKISKCVHSCGLKEKQQMVITNVYKTHAFLYSSKIVMEHYPRQHSFLQMSCYVVDIFLTTSDSSFMSNFLPHPVTVYWHRADQSRRWLYTARRLAR